MFNYLLEILAKIGLSLIAIIFTLRWFIFIPYIWSRYDAPILKLKTELQDFKEKARKQAVASIVIDRQIDHKSLLMNEQIENLEAKRRLFLDRVNLFLSIGSIKQ